MSRVKTPSLANLSPEDAYFELQAYMGTTKHMGGLTTTKRLVELCDVTRHTSILDVGCGVGATACYLATTYGCEVVGVDLRESMIRQAKARAVDQNVENLVTFKVADATELPFDDATFDRVLCESVITFIADKASVLHEFARVVKPGGYVGLNEESWLRPPTPEVKASVRYLWGIIPEIGTPENWISLMEEAGLVDITSEVLHFDTKIEATQVKRYQFMDMVNMLSRTMKLYVTDNHFRQYMKGRRRLPKHFFDYLGYVLTVGKRPDSTEVN